MAISLSEGCCSGAGDLFVSTGENRIASDLMDVVMV